VKQIESGGENYEQFDNLGIGMPKLLLTTRDGSERSHRARKLLGGALKSPNGVMIIGDYGYWAGVRKP
jgi:hypothetical protein